MIFRLNNWAVSYRVKPYSWYLKVWFVMIISFLYLSFLFHFSIFCFIFFVFVCTSYIFVNWFYPSQYIGSKETDLKADQVLKLGIFDCWTPENHYRWSKSRYGGHVSGSVEVVKQSRLLLSGMFLQTL